MSRWIFYVSPEEPVWGRYLQTGKPCYPSRESPPHQFHHPQALVILGICPPPYIRFPFILSFPLLFFFFLASHWSDCSWTIFQPAAFVSKQLYLLGYRLLSRIIYIMLSPFIIFWLKTIWHMIVDPAQLLETKILCLGQNVDQRRTYSLHFSQMGNKWK